jgi:hypothetical protein
MQGIVNFYTVCKSSLGVYHNPEGLCETRSLGGANRLTSLQIFTPKQGFLFFHKIFK